MRQALSTPRHLIKALFFVLTLVACSRTSKQLAPPSLENCKINFFIEKSLKIDQIKERIHYTYTFRDDHTFKMRADSSSAEQFHWQTEGLFDYDVKSGTKATLLLIHPQKTEQNDPYTIYLLFEDAQSGTWETTGSALFSEAMGGSFMLTKRGT